MSKFIMPAIFVGHGSPTNANEDNAYTRSWKKIGSDLPRPKAILCISAHWNSEKTLISNLKDPRQIYDFYGFPEELYDLKYPAAGSPELAKQVKELLAPICEVEYDNNWGLDHGAWVPLSRIFPQADIPVVQLSLDYTKEASFHYALGQALRPLREQGVLIIGSGNIVHNLGRVEFGETVTPYDWATEFDELVAKLIESKDYDKLINFNDLGAAARLAIPTPEHYLPLLYILGLQTDAEKLNSFAEGIAYKSISMRSYWLK